MLADEARAILTNCAHENRTTWNQLTPDERHTLSCHYLYNDDQPLCDADVDKRLSFVVAEYLYKQDVESLLALLATLKITFLTGDQNNEAHYQQLIEDRLVERWDDLNDTPDENFEDDVMQRAHDARSAQR